MKCKNCLKENAENFVFCRCCGVKNNPSEFDLIAEHTSDIEFYAKRAKELAGIRKLYDAIEFYSKCIELDATNIDMYIARGDCYGRILCCQIKGLKYAEALIDYEMALRLNPNSVEALTKYARALQGLRKDYKSIIYFNKALKIDPKYVSALSGKAFSRLRLKDYDYAKKVALKAIKISPNDTESLYVYGYALARTGEFEKGITIIKSLSDNGMHIARMLLNNFKSRVNIN